MCRPAKLPIAVSHISGYIRILPIRHISGTSKERASSMTSTTPTTAGARENETVPRHAKNFLRWRIHPIAKKLGIPAELVTFQVMRRTLGTDLQQHGTMKDAQQILRHASIRTMANVYMQPIPASGVSAINSRTKAIFQTRNQVTSSKTPTTTVPNGSKFAGGGTASA